MTQIVEFAREELGLTLYAGQVEVLEDFETGGYQHAVWQCGRRSGKSLMADVMVLYDALCRDELRVKLRPTELRVCGILSPKQEQSRKHIRDILGMIETNPHLAARVARKTSDEIEFVNGSVIQSFTCSARGFRGMACSSVILDEFGHFLTTEDGNTTGDMVYQAVRPSLMQFGAAGWLITISTPLWRQGMFWELVKRHQAGQTPYVHYVKRPSFAMNPTPEILAEAEKVRLEDPAFYAQEYLAEFVDGVSSYLNADDVLACKRDTNRLAPSGAYTYAAAIDPAYQHDNFALCIGHAEGERVVIDGVWVWRRAGHEFTIGEIARLCQEYRVHEVRTDQHAPVPIRESLERYQLDVRYVPWTNESKNEAFNRLKIRANLRTLSLPNDDDLSSELLSLEARPSLGGLTRIGAVRGAFDDRAVSVASVVQALDRANEIAVIFAGDDESKLQGLSDGDDLTDWERLLVDKRTPSWLQ